LIGFEYRKGVTMAKKAVTKKGRGAGACGGTRRKDGSGGGTGNRGTGRQPKR